MIELYLKWSLFDFYWALEYKLLHKFTRKVMHRILCKNNSLNIII